MENNEPLSEELVIVGYKHGVYADKLNPIMNGEPMKEKSLKELLADDVVALFMEPNEFDENSIGVYNMDSQLIGHLWSVQAAALRKWMYSNQCDFVKARIDCVVCEAEALIATPLVPLKLDLSEPCNKNIDSKWAYNVPEVLQSLEDQSLAVGMTLLRNLLAEAKEWDEKLEYRIDNIMNYLPIDLSAHRFTECIDVYNMMRASEIEELRQKSGVMLGKLIKRGSKNQLMWWQENWLPSFFEWASEGDLMAIYQAAGYNIERVTELLNRAPCGLFYMYQANKFRFAKHLLYSYLPKDVYDRLLTLLALWEMMKSSVQSYSSEQNAEVREQSSVQSKKEKMKVKVASTIEKMYMEGVMKYKYDYTWLMMAMNEIDDLPDFDFPTAFFDYLNSCHIKMPLPNRTSIGRYYDKAKGSFPNWTYTDANERETNRRNNIAKRFMSLFKSA